MSTAADFPTNSLEIIRPFIESMRLSNDIQIMGGLGTAALADPRVAINTMDKEVYAPKGFFLPAHRDDGTKRDVDVLLLSSDEQRTREVEGILFDTVGDGLEQAVFSLRPYEALQAQMAHPLGLRAFRTFVSDRYEAASTLRSGYVKSLFPFAVPLPVETLEPWTLYIGDDDLPIPIPHPGTTINNYTSRSIGGLRPRDIDKMTHTTENILTIAPEIREWIIDGPGRTQFELSTAIASLRYKTPTHISLVDGIKARTLSRDELAEHPAFMLPELDYEDKMRVLGVAAFKARAMHSLEGSPFVVTLWRQFAEKRADAIVKNR